jgi:hypothetical protein
MYQQLWTLLERVLRWPCGRASLLLSEPTLALPLCRREGWTVLARHLLKLGTRTADIFVLQRTAAVPPPSSTTPADDARGTKRLLETADKEC